MTKDVHDTFCISLKGLRTQPDNGMTLRDWFAGQALIGISSNIPKEMQISSEFDCGTTVGEATAKTAYEIADAMIEARKS